MKTHTHRMEHRTGRWLVAIAALVCGLCGAFAAAAATGTQANEPRASNEELVLYCSADAVYAKPVLEAFERESGIRLKPVFDTEATKTFGLVQRLINEKASPKADVFLSSEAMGMIRLARAGVLDRYTSASAERAFEKSGGWPKMLRAEDGTWYGFARRLRVLVYNTRHIKPEDLPTRLADLTHPRFKGRVGIARPEFGTTRGHIGALLMSAGEGHFTAWCEGLKANDLRMFDGNMSVVRAVGRGEIHIGLTDTDDVYAGLANEWPIAGLAVSDQLQGTTHDRAPVSPAGDPGQSGVLLLPYPEHPMQMPHTVGIVKGAKNRAAAEKFVDFMMGGEADRLLSRGDARTYLTHMADPLSVDPDHPAAERTGPSKMPSTDRLMLMQINLEEAASRVEEALAIWNRVMTAK